MSEIRYLENPWCREVMVEVGPLATWADTATGPVKKVLDKPTEGRMLTFYGDGTPNYHRIAFTAEAHYLESALPSVIRIYNLSAQTRTDLAIPGAEVALSVKYRGDEVWTQLFIGPIWHVSSKKEGPDYVTTIKTLTVGASALRVAATGPLLAEEVSDVTLARAVQWRPVENTTFAEGSTIAGIVTYLAKQIIGIKVDPSKIQIDKKLKVGKGGYTAYGMMIDVLNDLARNYGFNWWNHLGYFVAKMDKDCLATRETTPTLSVENGTLLGAEVIVDGPWSQDSGCKIQTFLNPWIVPGQLVHVESTVNPKLTGRWQVTTLRHRGDTHTKDWITEIDSLFSAVNQVGASQAGGLTPAQLAAQGSPDNLGFMPKSSEVMARFIAVASNEIGVQGNPRLQGGGGAQSPRVLEYIQAGTSPGARVDQFAPWCAAFVSWVIGQVAGVQAPHLMSSRAFLNWGVPLPKNQVPPVGAIIIFSRGSDPTKGHVGFFAGMGTGANAGKWMILGGNQGTTYHKGGEVSLSPRSPSAVVGISAPKGT